MHGSAEKKKKRAFAGFIRLNSWADYSIILCMIFNKMGFGNLNSKNMEMIRREEEPF